MPRKGISRTDIMNMALELVIEKGYENFSVRELAAKLDIKPASLYNHIDGIEEINIYIAHEAANALNTTLAEAINGKSKDDAFMAATIAYRNFAIENAEIYKALIQMPTSQDEHIVKAAFKSFAPLRELVKSYGLSKEKTINYIRGLRAVMHGFVELCNSGFMTSEVVSRDESYEKIMQYYLRTLKEIADE